MAYVKKTGLECQQESSDDKKITIVKARAKPSKKAPCKCKKACAGKKAHKQAKTIWAIVLGAIRKFWRTACG